MSNTYLFSRRNTNTDTTDGTFIKTFSYQFEAREYLQKEYDITSFIKISDVYQDQDIVLLDLYLNISNLVSK